MYAFDACLCSFSISLSLFSPSASLSFVYCFVSYFSGYSPYASCWFECAKKSVPNPWVDKRTRRAERLALPDIVSSTFGRREYDIFFCIVCFKTLGSYSDDDSCVWRPDRNHSVDKCNWNWRIGVISLLDVIVSVSMFFLISFLTFCISLTYNIRQHWRHVRERSQIDWR